MLFLQPNYSWSNQLDETSELKTNFRLAKLLIEEYKAKAQLRKSELNTLFCVGELDTYGIQMLIVKYNKHVDVGHDA